MSEAVTATATIQVLRWDGELPGGGIDSGEVLRVGSVRYCFTPNPTGEAVFGAMPNPVRVPEFEIDAADPAALAAVLAAEISITGTAQCEATSDGDLITLTANVPGSAGNLILLDCSLTSDPPAFAFTPFSGGVDGISTTGFTPATLPAAKVWEGRLFSPGTYEVPTEAVAWLQGTADIAPPVDPPEAELRAITIAARPAALPTFTGICPEAILVE